MRRSSLPRRQAIHSRAADALARGRIDASSVDLAGHLLGAGRFEEAVPICLRSAEEAEATLAFGEAISILERVLPHVADPLENARILCRIGRDQQRNGAPASGVGYLTEWHRKRSRAWASPSRRPATASSSDAVTGSRSGRMRLGRSTSAPSTVLEPAGPSADLSMAHQRLAGMSAFELDYRGCLESAQRAVEIAEQVGADLERVWALGFVALGYIDGGDAGARPGPDGRVFSRKLARRGYSQIASNVAWNNIWTRTHMMLSGSRTGSSDSSRFRSTRGSVIAPEISFAGATSRPFGGTSKRAWRHAQAAVERHARWASGRWSGGPGSTRLRSWPSWGGREEAVDSPAHCVDEDRAAGHRLRRRRPDQDGDRRSGESTKPSRSPRRYARTPKRSPPTGRPWRSPPRSSWRLARLDEVETSLPQSRAPARPRSGAAYLDQIEGALALARGERKGCRGGTSTSLIEAASEAGYPLVELRGRTQRARALSAAGRSQEAAG